MIKIISLFAILFLFWFFLYNFFYSPKAQIKRLKRSLFIHKIDYREVEHISGNNTFSESDKKTKRLINALIDEYLKDDEEFVRQYRYPDEELV